MSDQQNTWHDEGDLSDDPIGDVEFDDDAVKRLREELDSGRLGAVSVWEAFVDWNGDTEQTRGSARHGEVLAPYILEGARRGDEEAIRALHWVATMRALERLGMFDEARTILDALDDEEIKELEEAEARREQADREAEPLRQEAERKARRVKAEALAPIVKQIRERFMAKADFNTARLDLLREANALAPEQFSWVAWCLADPTLFPNRFMRQAFEAGYKAFNDWLHQAGFYGGASPPRCVRPDALLPPEAQKLVAIRFRDKAAWFLAPENWERLPRQARLAWEQGMDPEQWAEQFAPKTVAPRRPADKAAAGRVLPRRAYQIGNEYIGMNDSVWKIVGRDPDTDWWYTLRFDVLQPDGSMRKHFRLPWAEPQKPGLSALRAVDLGTFNAAVQKVEAQKAVAEKTAALKVRHGAAPRSVPLPEDPTVQQFAAAVGIPATEVQNHLRERRAKLLGMADRITPDLLSSLSDDYNVIPDVVDAAE